MSCVFGDDYTSTARTASYILGFGGFQQVSSWRPLPWQLPSSGAELGELRDWFPESVFQSGHVPTVQSNPDPNGFHGLDPSRWLCRMRPENRSWSCVSRCTYPLICRRYTYGCKCLFLNKLQANHRFLSSCSHFVSIYSDLNPNFTTSIVATVEYFWILLTSEEFQLSEFWWLATLVGSSGPVLHLFLVTPKLSARG